MLRAYIGMSSRRSLLRGGSPDADEEDMVLALRLRPFLGRSDGLC